MPVTGRLLYLDVLRALAIFMVLGAHQPDQLQGHHWGGIVFRHAQKVGWVGVDLFFVLSGFLIGGLLFDEYLKRNTINLRRFYVRRAFKIWPSYFVFLFVCIAIAAATGSHHPVVWEAWYEAGKYRTIWSNFLHIQNYVPSYYGHTWSLAVEEHFYLVMPFALLLIAGRTAKPFAWVLPMYCVVAVTCLLLRLNADGLPYGQTHFRIDSLFAGVTLAYLTRFHSRVIERIRPYGWLLLLIGGLIYLPFTRYDFRTPFTYTYGFTVIAFGSCCLTLWAWFASQNAARPAPKLMRLAALIGTYSYSIYLWHSPFGRGFSLWATTHLLPSNHEAYYLVLYAVYVPAAVLIGMVMYRLIEAPALALRDRFFSAKPAAKSDQALAVPSPAHQ